MGDSSGGISSEDVTEGDRTTRCRTCGLEVDLTRWHPVSARIDDNDEFHLSAFCSVACRTRWEWR